MRHVPQEVPSFPNGRQEVASKKTPRIEYNHACSIPAHEAWYDGHEEKFNDMFMDIGFLQSNQIQFALIVASELHKVRITHSILQ